MSILAHTLKQLLTPSAKPPVAPTPDATEKCVLNVGGNNKAIPIPPHYAGWRHDLLDIDPAGNPDIVCDAREMHTLPGGLYDAIYCSHNLEHYHRHHARRVLQGFRHVLKPEGFVELRVPDIRQVIAVLHAKGMELDDELYVSPAGPITAHDVIYGYHVEIERSGQDFYAHKMGFTPQSMTRMLEEAGFAGIYVGAQHYLEMHAVAFRSELAEKNLAYLEIIKQSYLDMWRARTGAAV